MVEASSLGQLSSGLIEVIRPFVRRARQLVDRSNVASVFFHRDADGVSAAAIFSQTLNQLGLETRLRAVLPGDLVTIRPTDGLNVFLDVGSGQLDILRKFFSRSPTLVVDHHRPATKGWRGLVHVNPYLMGYDGSVDVSGAGLSYLLSSKLFSRPSVRRKEMPEIGVVGAVADRQDFLGELRGMNKFILKRAEAAGLVEEEKDVLLFGRGSRPLHIALRAFRDPPIPGVTGSEAGALELLSRLHIPVNNGEGFRTLRDLSDDERRRLATEIVIRCASSVPPELARYIPRLVIGSVYRMVGEASPLEYASEYASFINASVRMGKVKEAVSLIQGDRGEALKSLRRAVNDYGKAISKEIRKLSLRGVRTGPRGLLQYFVSTTVPAELLGPVTGLLIGTGIVDPYRPVMGVAKRDKVKISVRCSKVLVLQGMDLSNCVERAAKSVGGTGGGHPGAAGAFIDSGDEDVFARNLEEEISRLPPFKEPPRGP